MTECINREKNEAQCPCPETNCARHGMCCECVRYHRNSKQWPTIACMP